MEMGNTSTNQILLNGTWYFSLDPHEEQNWHEQQSLPSDQIQVPGSWEEQGYGEPSPHEPLGTWKKPNEYEGVAWYVKEVEIPEHFQTQRVYLTLKGVRWVSKLWIDGIYVGEQDSLVTPHRYEITSYVHAGKTHRFAIRIDNRMKLPLHESHIHSYHTSTYWGGITGGIELEAEQRGAIRSVRIYPHVMQRQLKISFDLDHDYPYSDSESWKIVAKVTDDSDRRVAEKAFEIDLSALRKKAFPLEMVMDLPEPEQLRLWSPDTPHLHQLELTLIKAGETFSTTTCRFGLRSFEAEGQQFLLNGVPVFLSGYVDCCVFPLTGYPVWDVEHYRKQFRTAKKYGFNHVRLHGWTPPEPFWIAADEEGMLVQTELPHWSRQYLDRGKEPDQATHEFLQRELHRILDQLQHHPSFVMMSMGNELIGDEGHPALNEFVNIARKKDATRLYTDNTGFGQLPAQDREGDYFIPTLNWHPPYHISQAATPDTAGDFREIARLEPKPLIAHEHGQFTMYVRPEEEQKYTGVLQPYWLKSIKETLSTRGMDKDVDRFIEATGKHMVASLKESLEKVRRTAGISGVQMLDIRDFPGQGHATVGILDVFWDSKQVIEPDSFQQFNGQTVLLMRTSSRTYFSGEPIQVELEVSHFGQPIPAALLKWEFELEDGTVHSGSKEVSNIAGGGLTELTRLSVSIHVKTAQKVRLKVVLSTKQHDFCNDWDFWVFPAWTQPEHTSRIWTNIEELRSILYGAQFSEWIGINEHTHIEVRDIDLAIASHLSRDVLQYVVDGGKAWLMIEADQLQDGVETKYLPIFWNYLWFPEQGGTTMGMLVHDHPALQNFPTNGCSEWHWYHLVNGATAIGLDTVSHIQPVVEVIDNFYRAKKLAYVFEAQVGKGKIFVSSLNTKDIKTMKKPEIQYFIAQSLRYLRSDSFQPEARLSVGELLGLFKVRSLIPLRSE